MAALVAGGLSNRQIAAQMVISVRTAETHVQHVMAKLGFTAAHADRRVGGGGGRREHRAAGLTTASQRAAPGQAGRCHLAAQAT